MTTARNAIGYARLSDLRLDDLDEDGNGRGNVDQVERIKAHAARIGWRVTRMIVENDVAPGRGQARRASAFKRRKLRLPDGRVELRVYRPGFRQALDLLADGTCDGFLALDLDRTVRDPRDLEDLIDVAEQHRVPVESVTGSLRLANDADITMARVMVAMANKASRDTARRVAAARERQARDGQYGGGKRPFGFEADGVTVRPEEARVIAEASNRFVQGASIRSLAADLRRRGVPTVFGSAWTAEALRDILSRPRNAGRMVYQGQEVADAPWDPIVPVETFRLIQRTLADPDRRLGPGPAPKWLGSGIYRCGICPPGEPRARMEVTMSKNARPVYRCKGGSHLRRSVAHTDDLVVGAVVARLSEPDTIELFMPERPEVDVEGLRAEADAIRANLNELAADRAMGLISRGQMLAATDQGTARLLEIEDQLRQAVVDSPVAPLLGATDVRAVWDGLPLSHQRLVLDELMTVTILRARVKGRGYFDTDSVKIDWKP